MKITVIVVIIADNCVVIVLAIRIKAKLPIMIKAIMSIRGIIGNEESSSFS